MDKEIFSEEEFNDYNEVAEQLDLVEQTYRSLGNLFSLGQAFEEQQ